MITSDFTISQIATEFPVSTRVFERYKINFCCGGGLSLAEACANRSLDPSVIAQEIEKEIEQATPEDLAGWSDRSNGDVIAHILARYHRPLDDELPRLEFLATKVARVHGASNPVLLDLAYTVVELKAELENHFQKEEMVLFPAILNDEAQKLACPIAVMLKDHEDVADFLLKIREYTDDFSAPPHACGSWRALWDGLHELERSLHEHIHLENNILFPRISAEN